MPDIKFTDSTTDIRDENSNQAQLGEKAWYVCNAYATHEKKVADNLKRRVESMGLQDFIFRIIVAEQDVPVMKDGMPTDKTYSISLDGFRPLWRFHPDANVDLCALQLSAVLSLAQRDGIELMISPFSVQQIASKDDLQKMVHGEDVYMIGYPDGIRDTVNNQPIFRRGVLATSPRFDLEGKPHFLTDMAVFPGSSGSPVVSIRYGMCVDTLRLVYRGFEKGKVKLLGVVFATHLHDSPGKIYEIATTNMMSLTQIPNNLGVVIKADRIIELEQLFGISK